MGSTKFTSNMSFHSGLVLVNIQPAGAECVLLANSFKEQQCRSLEDYIVTS